jgi:hypothetical protein
MNTYHLQIAHNRFHSEEQGIAVLLAVIALSLLSLVGRLMMLT